MKKFMPVIIFFLVFEDVEVDLDFRGLFIEAGFKF